MKKFLISLMLCFIFTSIYAEEMFEYRICIKDVLDLREKGDINSHFLTVNGAGGKVKVQLHITQSVKVLQVDKRETIVNGNKGRWILIDTSTYDYLTRKPIQGWVFDYYLAKKEDFIPLNSLPNDLVLVFDDGDALFKFKFFKNGTVHFFDEKKIMKGKLYIDNRNKVVVVKYDEQKELVLWSDSFIYRDGKICQNSIELDKTCSRVVE